MKGDTDILLDRAEMEHGSKAEWFDGWLEADMFVPFDPDEREILCPEPIKSSKCKLFIPAGMIVWMECNHPGRIYISGRDWYNWSDFNGYFPCEVTWDFALAMITSGDGDEPYNLEVCGPLSEECRAEMESRACGREP